ncbi:MAG: hypothetical protein Q8M92_02500, partial [Candidatus Subteraquimicrobiales bacterium]|nr:hypothetical protein [Candidatus Subteraquimicrobiales bacterium]
AGTDIASAFDGITNAVANQTMRGLKLYGIIVDQNKAFEDYAKKIGVSKDALTEMQQSQALANAAIEEGGRQMKAMGDINENSAEKIQRATAQMQELKETVGKVLLIALQAAGIAMYVVAAAALVLSASFWKTVEAGTRLLALFTFGDAKKRMEEFADFARDSANIAYESAAEMLGKTVTIWEGMSWGVDDAAEKTKGLAKTQMDAAGAAQQLKQSIELTTKALQEQSKAISKLGADMLKFAGDEFSESLKTQVESIKKAQEAYFKLSAAGDRYFANLELQKMSTEGMTKSLTGYLGVIDSVYEKQLAGQRTIKIKMELAGADKGAMAQQSMAILETEKAQATARLGVWSQYYDILKGLHSQAIDAQKQKTLELLELEKAIRAQWQGYTDLYLSLQQKLMTESEKYYSTQQNLETKYQAAMALTGQAKIDALNQYQQAAAGAAQEIVQDGEVIVSLENAVVAAMQRVNRAQEAIASEQEKLKAAKQAEIDQVKVWSADLSTAMAAARAEMETYKALIIDLGNTINSMSLSIKVDNSQALAAVGEVKAKIDSIPDVTYKKIIMEVVTKASPERPFSEGMGYIEDRLGSLPTGGKYTMDFSAVMSAIKMMKDMQMDAASLKAQAMAFGPFPGQAASTNILNESADTIKRLINMMMEEKSSYASGVSYVPSTGRYQLHEGEVVLNRREAASYDQRKTTSITFAPNINLSGAGKDPRQLAREIVKPLQDEMRRMAAYN